MLASGDLDGMKSLFEFYGSFLAVSKYRASKWFPELLNDAARLSTERRRDRDEGAAFDSAFQFFRECE